MLKMYHSGTELKDIVINGCPFCGSKNLTISEKESYERLCEENGSALMQIECKCGVSNRLYDIPSNNYWIGVGMLVAKWNARVADENSDRD